jgi:homoaconitase/3-isopropylmalate dehydratase large subunit
MASIEVSLKEAMTIPGAVAVCLVDHTSGMSLGSEGSGIDLDVAAAGNTDVVRAKLRTMKALGIEGSIEDILITLDTQYHLIRLITSKTGQGLFLYMALNKAQANLAMARRQLANIENELDI